MAKLVIINHTIFVGILKTSDYICTMKKSSFIFDDVCLSPKWQIGRNSHSTWELDYIINGSGTRSIGNLSELIAEKEIILIPPGIPHIWTFKEQVGDENCEVSNLSVFFKSSLLENISGLFPEMTESVNRLLSYHDAISFLDDDHDKIERLLLSMQGSTPEERFPKMIELIIVLSNSIKHRFVGSGKDQSTTEKKFEKIRVFLKCNYNRAITLNEIADYMDMNKSSLCTFMRKHTGMTITEYLNEIRLSVAGEYLLNIDETISSIAYNVGFSDITYFNRLFRRKYGLTPSQYRKTRNLHGNQ